MNPSEQNRFEYAGLTDVGRVRDTNQDRILMCPEYNFFAVIDGMGGLSDGESTADAIAQTMPLFFEEYYRDVNFLRVNPKASCLFAKQFISKTICDISDAIHDKNLASGDIVFGATLTCVWFIEKEAIFANIGDSRGYIFDNLRKELSRITTDHNIAAVLVDKHELSAEQASNHELSRKLTRFVGMPPPAIPDIYITDILPGDTFFLCSDGVTSMLTDKQIETILRRNTEINETCSVIVDQSNRNGGKDNIAAICVKPLLNNSSDEDLERPPTK